jgi:glycosyltransferase involved in cell wall biosynthesis
MRALRGDRLIIAIEDDNSRPLLGPLRILATATRMRQVVVVWPDLTLEPMPSWKILPMLWALGVEQMRSRLALRRVCKSAAIPTSPRSLSPVVTPPRGRGIFLDANLSFGLSAGGSLGHIKGVIDGLINRGYQMDYVSTKPMPTDKEGATYVKVPPPNLLAFPAELNYYSFHHDFDRAARQAMQRRPVDFIYQRMSLHNISGVDLSRSAGVPLVIEYNGSEVWAAANWGQKLSLHDAAMAAERHILRAADLVVTVSAPLATELMQMGIAEDRVVMYPNCIDPAIFSPSRFDGTHRNVLRAKLGIASDARVATFIGTFGAWHGVDFLARGIRRLIEEDPDFIERYKIHFLLIGDGLRKPEVIEAVGIAPYSHYVSLPGLVPQSQAAGYLAISDIFLSPHMPNPDGSAFFGSPTKLFEYMAMGHPIVASDLDQIGTILRGALNGLPKEPPMAVLYPPGDETAMLNALRRAVIDTDSAEEMAARARAHVLNNFTWDHHVGRILDRMISIGLLAGDGRKKEHQRHG